MTDYYDPTPDQPTLAEALREPCPAPLNLWFPTLMFFLGLAIGGGAVLCHLTGALW